MPKTPHSSLKATQSLPWGERLASLARRDVARYAARPVIPSASADDHRFSASASRQSIATWPFTLILTSGPPVRPTRAAGTPAARAFASTDAALVGRDADDDARRRFAEQRRGQTIDPAVRRRFRNLDLRADAARSRSNTRPARRPGRLRRSHAPIAPAPCAGEVDEEMLQRPLARQVERRRHAAHHAMHGLQVLAAAQFAEILAEQHHVETRIRKGTRQTSSTRPQ